MEPKLLMTGNDWGPSVTEQMWSRLCHRLRQDDVMIEFITSSDPFSLRNGEPCKHPGCLSHISHPCEGCGRIGGRRANSDSDEADQ